MISIAISGATGNLGRLITKQVAKRVPASSITLTSRSPEKLGKEADAGMRVCHADYRDRESLDAAYAGCDALMLISGLNIRERVAEHRNAIEAAEKAGIQHIVYTSVSGVHPMNRTPSSEEHYATEQMLHQSNLSFTALRNQLYSELVTPMAEVSLLTGKWEQVGENSLLSPISQEDIALCAATILCEPEKHKNVCYEMTGPELISFQEVAKRFEDMYNRPIEYVPLTAEEMLAKFDEWGVPRIGDPAGPVPICYGSDELVKNYVALDQLFHAVLSHHVEFITGKKPKTLHTTMLEAKEKMMAHLAAVSDAQQTV